MWKRIIKAWRVLMGTPTYNDDESFMNTKREMELLLKDLEHCMVSVREFIPVMHSHQEFMKINVQVKRLILFIRNNYGREITDGQHSRFLTVIDVALFYLNRELEGRGREVTPAPTEREVMLMDNAVGLGPVADPKHMDGGHHWPIQGGPNG